jgi:hypothetical protein
LGWAAVSGVGFAVFYLCIKQAGDGSPLWIVFCARVMSFLMTSLFVILGKHVGTIERGVLVIAVVAGCFDITGSALFVRQTPPRGRDVQPQRPSVHWAVLLHEHFQLWQDGGYA